MLVYIWMYTFLPLRYNQHMDTSEVYVVETKSVIGMSYFNNWGKILLLEH